MMKKIAELKEYFSHRKTAVITFIIFSFFISGISAADLTWNSAITDVAIYNTDSTVDVTADIAISTLKIFNRTNNAATNHCVIDLKGHKLTISTLIIGQYGLLVADYAGSVEFVDSVGGGSVEIGTLDATAYYYQKRLIITSPVTVTINTKLDSNAGGKNYSDLEISGNGNLVLNGTVTKDDNVKATGVVVTGTNAAALTSSIRWTGASSEDWSTVANWSGISNISELKTAPIITIPSGLTNYPIASDAVNVELDGKLVIENNASVIFAGNATLNTVDAAGGKITTGADRSITIKGNASVKNITLGTGETLTCNGELNLENITAPANSKLSFNQGADNQTTTISNMNFSGSTINFGNSAGDIFNMGAAGTDPLDISSASTVTLAGAINTSTLKMGGAATTVTDITLPKLVISSDLTVTGGKKVTFGGNVNAGADDVKLAITGPVVLSAGCAIGNVTAPKIGDITFTGNYEGLNNSPITCAGDFTINGTAMFRGDITVGTIKVTGEMSFGSACGKIHSTGSQTYGTAGSIVNINMWRNNEYDEPTEFIAGDNETINFYANILGFNGGKQPIKLGSTYRATDLLQNVHIYGSLGTSTYPMDFIEANCNLTVDGKIIAKSLCVKGTASLGGNVTTVDPYATKTITADGTKSQIYKGDVTLNNDVVLSAGNNSVCFEGKVNGGTTKALSVGNGTDETNAIFGSSVTAKTVSVKGTTSLAGDVTTAGAQTYTGLVSLADDVILVGGTSTVTMSGGVASATTDEKSLTAGSGASATKLAVSGNTGTTTKPLKDLTVYGDFEVTSSGTINAKGDVVLEKAAFFRGNVNAGTLTVGGVTTVGLATSKIETTGAQDYKSDVKINTTNNTEQNHTFIAGDTGVTFEGKVIRYDAVTALPNLAIGDRGNSKKTDVSFKDDVSGMVNIDVYGTANFDGATAVTTSENQTYENIAASSAVSLETTDVTKKITIKGDNTVAAAVTLKASADITGSNTFAELNIGDGTQTSDITITFTAGETETINGITSKGTAANPVLITGTGNWTADLSGAATKIFEYTLIDKSTADPAQSFSPNKAKLYDYGVYNGSAATSKNWFSFVYKWNGTTTDWETVSNWTDASGNAVSEFPESTTGVSEILIPDGCTAYPEIAAGKAYKLASIETEAAGKITLSDENITLTGDSPLVNAGTIIFTDSGRITNSAVIPVPIMDNTQGTVEYQSGSGDVTDYHSDKTISDYYNLVITSGTWNIQGSKNIKAEASFENKSTLGMKDASEINSSFKNSGTLEIAAGAGVAMWNDFENTSGATVNIGVDSSLWFANDCNSITDKGTINFGTNSNIVFYGTADIAFESETASTQYIFNTASKTGGTVTFSGKDATHLMQIAGFTDAAASCESKFNNVKFINDTTFNSSITSGTTGNITFDAIPTFNKLLNITAGTLTFNNDATLNNGSEIESDGNNITIASGKIVSSKDDFTITKGNLQLYGAIICDGNTVATGDDKSITLQNVEVKDSAEIKAKEITITGSITPDTTAVRDITLTATTGNINIGAESNPNAIEIGTEALKFRNVTLETVANDITFAGSSNIKATDTVTVTGNNITFSGAIITDKLVVNAKTSLTLQPGYGATGTEIAPANSLVANSLVVNAAGGSNPAITYSGTIDLSGGTDDFVIDHPVKIKGDTHFKVGGNFVLDNTGTATVGSLNPDVNGNYYVQITPAAGKTIQLNNDFASTATSFERIIFNGPVVFNQAHAIYAGTTDMAAKCTSVTVTDSSKPHYTVSGSLIVRAPVTFPNDKIFVVPGTFYNRSTTSPVFPQNLEVRGNFDDNGKWNPSQKIYLTGANNTQKFTTTDSTVSYDIVVNKTGTNSAVNFTSGITVDKFDVKTNSYKGKIIFSGTAAQTFKAESDYAYGTIEVNKAVFDDDGNRTGASTGDLVITNKTAPTSSAQGLLTANSLSIKNGSVKFTDMDVTTTSIMNWETPDTVYISGGENGNPVTFTAPGFHTVSHIIPEDDKASYLYIDASAGGNINIGADLGASGNVFKSVVLNAGTSSGRTVHVSGQVWSEYYEIFCYQVSLANEVHTWELTIHASDISINGLTTNSLSLNPDAAHDPANPKIALGGNIVLQKVDTDFIIDYPLQVIQGNFFEADNVTPVVNPPYDLVLNVNGNIIIKDNGASKGSVNSNVADSKRRVKFAVQNPAKKLLIQNGATAGAGIGSASGRELGEVAFACNVDLTDNTIVTADKVSVEDGITIAPETVGNDVTLKIKGAQNILADAGAGISAETKGFVNEGTGTYNVNLEIASGDVNDLGTWNQTGKKIMFTGAAAQVFNGKAGSTYETVEINQANNIAATVEFADTTGFNITDLSVLKSKKVIVNAPVTVTNFADNANSKELEIAKDTVFTNIANADNQTLYTTALTVDAGATFGIGAAPSYKNLTHTAGLTTVNGTLYGADVDLAAVSISGKIETTGSQNFNSTITLTGDSELEGSQLQFTAATANINLDAADASHKLTVTSGDIRGQGSNANIVFAPEVIISAQDTTVTVTGTATFNKALSGNTANDFTVAGNANFVTTDSTVDSFKAFTVTGNASFRAPVGNAAAVDSLKISGTTAVNDASIKTTNTQTYSDNISITTNATLSASEVILNKTDAVAPASSIQTVTGTKLTLDTPKLTSDQNIDVASPVELLQSVEVGGAKNITFKAATGASAYSITVAGDVTFQGNTINSSVVNNGTVTCGGNVTFAETYSTASGESATFNASAGTVTFNKDVDFTGNTFVSNGGTVKLSPTGTKLVLGGSIATYNTVNITGSVDITDANIFVNLTATSLENKTITFPATLAKMQTVTTSLKLTGTADADDKRLILKSDSPSATTETDCFYINFTGTNNDTNYSIRYVDMQNGYNARKDGTEPDYLSVKDSKDSENNYYWNFPGATYNWTGATDTDWFTPANWYPKSLPGMGAKVVVSSSFNSNPVTNFPSIDEDAITLGNSGALSGSITINDGAMIDFQDATVTVGTINNYGKVYSLGINTIGGTKNNGDATNGYGTVIYYGEGITTASWGENYYNLSFGDRDDLLQSNPDHKLSAGTISTKLDVSGTLVIKNNSNGKTLTLSSVTNNFTHGTAPSITNNPVEIDSANENIVLASNGTLKLAADVACSSLEVTGTVSLLGNVTTTAAQTYNNDVVLESDATLKAGTGSAITFEASAGKSGTGNSDYVLKLDGNVIFGDAAIINSKYVMPSLTQDSSWALATPAAGKAINIATDIFCDFASSNTLTISDDLTCKNFIAYSGKVTVAANKTLATSADCNFVALGSNYSADDPRYSNTDTRFAYYFANEPAYKPAGAIYSDNILTGITPATILTAGTGSKIKTGQNFYVNGLNLSGFTLELNEPTSNPTLNTTDKVTATQWGTPYAVAFNSKISNVTASGAYLTAATAQKNTDGSGNTKVQFEVPQIIKAYTVYDDVIYIAFNVPIENSNGDINSKLAVGTNLQTGGMYYNNKSIKFAGAYADADCTTSLPNGDIKTADADGNYGFYVKTVNEKWNTDADGKNPWSTTATASTSADSKDRSGNHHSVTVDLSFLEGVFVAADGFTMSENYGIGNLANGSAAPVYDATADKCAPVLLAVLTGKEKHIAPSGAASTPVTENQQPFDGHNFIEFRYSEPVDVGTMLAAGGATNIGSSDSLGNIQTMGTGINVKGLASIASGSVTAASKLGGTTPVHSLYRKFSKTKDGTFETQTHKVRVAIAGYVSGTVTSSGKSYYNWTSYIESAVMPSGAVTRIAGGTQVKDKAGNAVAIESTTNHPLTQLYVNQIKNAGAGAGGADVYTDIETDALYNKWDVTPPSFAPLRYNGITSWTILKNPNSSTEYEALGAAYSGSTTLNAIEFHMFDDTPTYAAGETVQWFTKIGWANAQAGDLNVSGSAIERAADTRGGIRYCTIYNLTNKFTYLRSGEASIRNFENTKNISGGAESSIFVAPENPTAPGAEDGCYFKVPLTDASGHDPKSEFKIYFDADDSSVYVTDLAGNLLKKISYTLNTVNRSSPSMNVTAAPCGKDELYIVFSKAINIDEIIGHTKDNVSEVKLNALEYIPKSLKVIGATDLEIDDTVSARVVHRTENATGFILKLNRDITIDDIKGGFYIEVIKSDEYPYDPLSGINAKVTLIQDMAGNYADAERQHALTDFAVNVIDPEFAHNTDMLDSNGSEIQLGLYSEGSWAVHSWGRDQGNYGTLNPEYDVFMRVQDPYDLLNGRTNTLYLSNNPTLNSVSYEYNRISGRDWRIWLPEISANIAPVANDNTVKLDGAADGTDAHIINYDIDLLSDSATYAGYDAGTTITFLFDTGLTVKHEGSTSATNSPLYALRLSDPNDVSSLDLWSIKLKTITAQRGGVSILNNVINPLNGEKSVLRLNMATAGSVNIMVMTLDGNIVTYLNRGEVEAGEQFFTWDGKNTSGKVVARGMYFIRVIGNGIDETRKVMIVK